MYTVQRAPGLFGTIGDSLNMFELVIRFTKQHFAICHCGLASSRKGSVHP